MDPIKRLPRNLYETFRDGIFDDAIKGVREFNAWSLVPMVHIGRQQTLALIQKFLARMQKDYPKGVSLVKGKYVIADEFAIFVQTHKEMGSQSEEMIAAWAAMLSME